MRKVFWDDPYQRHLRTRVASVEGNELLFDETIAYSFSGGQESDRASVNGLPILNSRMESGVIYYTLPEGHGLSVDDAVEMEIDWTRRYRLMRLHFAAELVLEIVTQKFHLEKVGAHISETKSRIDFVFPEHINSLFEPILEEYNKIIREDRKIETGFTDAATQRRFWKIDGFAQVPCGGTHVKSTAEVGFVHLKRARSGKGIERIEMTLVDDHSHDVPASQGRRDSALRQAIDEEMTRDDRVFVIGEEVGLYNGPFKVTKGLLDKWGPTRIVDTPISESGFVGIAIGAAQTGLCPIVDFMTWNFSFHLNLIEYLHGNST